MHWADEQRRLDSKRVEVAFCNTVMVLFLAALGHSGTARTANASSFDGCKWRPPLLLSLDCDRIAILVRAHPSPRWPQTGAVQAGTPAVDAC
jgi:hypothetical protein